MSLNMLWYMLCKCVCICVNTYMLWYVHDTNTFKIGVFEDCVSIIIPKTIKELRLHFKCVECVLSLFHAVAQFV